MAHSEPIQLSPDGRWYLLAAAGKRVPMPYARRWLLPRLLGPHPRRWAAITYAALLATPAAAWWFFGTMGLDGWHRAYAAALLCCLPGVWRASLAFPVLTDAPGFCGALCVAALARSGHSGAAALLALALGATRESAAVFAALWAWDLSPLAGLAAVGWWRPAAPPPPDEPWLAHPLRDIPRQRWAAGLREDLYLRPWGAALLGLLAPSWQIAAAALVAHGQLLIATDTSRLTVWCAPVLVAAAAQATPPAWWLLALVVTLVRGRGAV